MHPLLTDPAMQKALIMKDNQLLFITVLTWHVLWLPSVAAVQNVYWC